MNTALLLRLGKSLFFRLGIVIGSATITLLLFLVLPLLQTIASEDEDDLIIRPASTTQIDPPEMIEEEPEEEEEEEEEEEAPELQEEAQPLELSQLELVLDGGGAGDGGMAADFEIKLNILSAGSNEMDNLFKVDDVEQKPRVIAPVSPIHTAQTRRKAPGTVHIIFTVNERGRVENPQVQRSDDPVFEGPALKALRQWRFEPAKRNGKPVPHRMRIPITFPARG